MKKNLAILLLACVASVERGSGKGEFGRARGTFSFARAQIPPSPSPFNAGHADYLIARQPSNVGGIRKAQHRYSTRYATMLQNKLRVS